MNTPFIVNPLKKAILLATSSMPYGVLYLCSLNKGGRRCGEFSFQKDFGGRQGLDNLVQLRMTITPEQYAGESKGLCLDSAATRHLFPLSLHYNSVDAFLYEPRFA